MLAEASWNWFIAQALACVVAYLLGRAVTSTSRSLQEIALLATVVALVGLALRGRVMEALVAVIPLDVLVYVEGTLIVPPFMFLAGILSAPKPGRSFEEGEGARLQLHTGKLGPMLATLGMVYLVVSGAWMVMPRVPASQIANVTMGAGFSQQSRDDTCVAAALATALRAPGIDLHVTEAEMADLADVRVGQGSTMVRALKAAELRLAGGDIEPRLYNYSAHEVVQMATASRPVLVTIRSGVSRTHMVAVLGMSRGKVLIANPWRTQRSSSVAGSGLERMSLEHFSKSYVGSAIVFIDRASR